MPALMCLQTLADVLCCLIIKFQDNFQSYEFIIFFFPLQTALEMRGSRNNVVSSEVEYMLRPVVTVSRTLPSPRYDQNMQNVRVLLIPTRFSSVSIVTVLHFFICPQGKCKDNNIITCFSLFKSITTIWTGTQELFSFATAPILWLCRPKWIHLK